ncbi:alpha/beta hydrolase [Chondrinema litorale]|uniref:alpha/beta hydrolase n=1 Tax=Chondrinema litorale TaxID=2994555 RepID=UPI002542CA53|nr:alpha/beta hydrolase [Chondrinema litorale]UZR93065.1 alpha/beta hydrolase [Chondrinema litorale]
MSSNRITSSVKSLRKSKVPVSSEDKVPFYFHLIRTGFKGLGPLAPRTSAKIAFKLFASPRKIKSKKKPSVIMDEARLFTISHRNRKIQCYAWGKTGPKVLLVHGWESKAAHLQNFVPPLLEMGYQVLAFDGPAHGNSEGKMTNMIDFGKVIEAIINETGKVDHIITHSFGSGATSTLLSEPDNSIAIEKLIMVTSPNKLQDIFNNFYNLLHIPKPVQNHFEVLVEQITNRSIENYVIANRLNTARVNKTMLVHDKTDNVLPFEYSKNIFAANPHIEYLVTEGKGHYKIIKDREVIEKVVEFIEN